MYLKRILTYSILSVIALGGFFGNIHIETRDNQMSNMAISYEGFATYAKGSNNSIPGFENTLGITPDTGKKETSSSASVKMYNDMIGTINIALAVLSAMISPIILFVGWLMSPDWTSGDIFGLRDPMYKLWVTVSNIVYFIYAILLILIALGTMFGQDKFSYKVMLPKLALGILMVPFTWWFVQWTISISSVVTASVMTIPTATIGVNDSAWFIKPSIPTQIWIDNTGTGTKTDKIDCNDPDKVSGCLSPKKFLEKSGGMYGPLIVYGYSIFKFEKINTLDTTLDIANAAIQLVHTSIVSTIMFAVFGLLTLALATMLLVRAIKLWMYAIFAPLFTFRFVAGSNLMGGDDDSFTIKEFIGLAFVPAIVGLTLSFGLIMINAVHGPGSSNTSATAGQECDLDPAKGKPCEILGIMGNPANSITRTIEHINKPEAYTSTVFKFADINFIFRGKASNQTDNKSTSSGALSSLGGMFGTLIVDVIALVFIWMAFMAAKNVSKAVKMAVEPFEKIGSQVGSLAKSIPKYTPLPLPGGSIHGMQKASADLAHLPEAAANKRYDESNVGKFMKSHNDSPNAQELEKLRGALNGTGEGLREALHGISQEKFKQMYPKIDENKSTVANAEYLRKAGITDSAEQKAIIELINKTSKSEDDYLKLHAMLVYNAKHDVDAVKAKNMIAAGKTAGTVAATTGYTSSTIPTAKKDDIVRQAITMEGIPIQVTADGKTLTGEIDKIIPKIKEQTEEEIRQKLSTIANQEVINKIITELKSGKVWPGKPKKPDAPTPPAAG